MTFFKRDVEIDFEKIDTDVVMMLAPMRVKWAGFGATGAESEAA